MLKMQLFLLFLTKEFGPEWCILLDGPASSGKTHVMKETAELFGVEGEDYFVYSRFTQSSLNHMEELAKKWEGKIVIIEELQGAKNVVEQLRVAISEGKLTLVETQEVEKNGVKTHETKAKEIVFKNVLFVTCNAEDFDEGEQLKSRAWILNTDQTENQTKEIITHYLDKFKGKKNKTPNLEEIRNCLRFLEKPHDIIFPFASDLQNMIPTSNVRGRRDVKKLICLLKASAYFHQKHRHWFEEDGKRVLVADWRDAMIVFGFAGEALFASSQGVGSKDLLYYSQIVSSIGITIPTFSIDDVSRWCKISYPSARKIMGNLMEAGFFENTTLPPAKASYQRSTITPYHMGDLVNECKIKMNNQDELLAEWLKMVSTGNEGGFE